MQLSSREAMVSGTGPQESPEPGMGVLCAEITKVLEGYWLRSTPSVASCSQSVSSECLFHGGVEQAHARVA